MLTLAQIQPYLKSDSKQIEAKYQHEYYGETVAYKNDLDKVFQKKYPDYMDKTRPRESVSNKNYRKSIYKNKWGHFVDRVAETLDYIQQADDFGITFPDQVKGVPDGLTLEDYTGNSLTPDGSLKDWFFNNAIYPYLTDPNACCAMVLENPPVDDAKFEAEGLFRPKPCIFPSENVIMHQKGRFCVLFSPEKRKYRTEAGEWAEGAVIHFFDDESYTAAFQQGSRVNALDQTVVDWVIIGHKHEVLFSESGEQYAESSLTPILHHFDYMPVYKLGKRKVKGNSKREELYRSMMDGAIVDIQEAQQIQNDLEIERVFHSTSAEWRLKSAVPPCSHPKCVSGSIIITDETGKITGTGQCPTCKGTGLNPTSGSALEVLLVNDAAPAGSIGSNQLNANKQAANTPGGYIEKSTEPLKIFREELDSVCGDIYRKINMQFINVVPNEASGTSKRYDREELYRELNTQGAHLIAQLLRQYEIGDNIRYTNFTYVGEQTPEIMAPVRFNLENAELTREELNDAKDKEYDPALIQVLEAKLLEYNVGTNSVEFKQYQTRVKLDPFRNMNTDEKNMAIGLMGVTLKDGEARNRVIELFLFSILLDALMIRAALENEDFYSKSIAEQRTILLAFMPDYFDGVREITYEIDEATGMPKMVQQALKPIVNIQDTNQTNERSRQATSFEK